MNAMNTDTVQYAAATAPKSRGLLGDLWADKARLRRIAMTWGVGIVVAVTVTMWLMGGRYVGTDDAYVHAQKLAVSTDVSGLVLDVDVKEGDHVKQGQVLFRLDPKPFMIALANAKANLANIGQTVDQTKSAYQAALGQIAAQTPNVTVAQLTYNRYAALAAEHAIAPAQLDQARGTLQSAQGSLIALRQDAEMQLAKLNGNPKLPMEQSPAYMQAKAAVDEAQRQLDHATVRAPFDGIVTEVDSLQPGTLVISALSAFSTTSAVGLVSEKNMWVEAAMKETDLTYVRNGNPVELSVDTYPGCTWTGHVNSVAAASDSAFSALPMENTSGNWVKVVQRIPTKISLDPQPKGSKCDLPLRAGMSTTISIDTGKRRWARLLNGD
ncbi:MAG TPA: HlyD family secretion protein [Rhizomicrobium sp.]|jgi:membrane fusion protein (multidrug efflux system)